MQNYYLKKAGLILFFFVPILVNAGGPFTVKYHTDRTLDFTFAQQIGGGFVIAGWESDTTLVRKIMMMGINESGHTLWSNHYVFSGFENCYSACHTSDGGIVLLCNTVEHPGSEVDLLVIKADSAGTVIWATIMDGPENDVGLVVCATNDSGCVIAGYNDSYTTNENLYLAKLDKSGNKVWSWLYDVGEPEIPTAIKPTMDGGFIITGWTASTVRWLVLKIDSTGASQWCRIFNVPQSINRSYDIIQLQDSGFIVAGIVHGDDNSALLKINKTGDVEWAKKYSSPNGYLSFNKISMNEAGLLILEGRALGSLPDYNELLVGIDTSGEVQWANMYDIGFYYFYDNLTHLNDSSFLIMGKIFIEYGMTILKTASMTDTSCSQTPTTILSDTISFSIDSSLVFSNPPDVFSYITVNVEPFVITDSLICPDTSTTGIKNFDSVFSGELSITVFNETCMLHFNKSEINSREFYLLNNLGQIVYSGRSDQKEVSISLAGLTPGIYRCCIVSGSGACSKSFAYLKN